MTREEILGMEAGFALDTLVELHVFNHTKSMYLQAGPYSTDIKAAWEVVKKMQSTPCKDGAHFVARIEGFTGTHIACFFHHLAGSPADYGLEYFEAIGKTAPEAICKAALLAVMEEKAEV